VSAPETLETNHPSDVWQQAVGMYGSNVKMDWSVRGYVGKVKGIGSNYKAHLVVFSEPIKAVGLIPCDGKVTPRSLPLEDLECKVERAFLFDELHLFSRKEEQGWVLRFRKTDYGKLLGVEDYLKPKPNAKESAEEPFTATNPEALKESP
jgi:hypothetical protein